MLSWYIILLNIVSLQIGTILDDVSDGVKRHYCGRGFSITLLEKFLIGSLHDVCMYIIPHVSPINWFPSYVSIIKQLRFFKVLKSFQIKSSVTFHLVTFTERKRKIFKIWPNFTQSLYFLPWNHAKHFLGGIWPERVSKCCIS